MSKKGFTLIEVVVSAGILMVALAGIFLVFNFGQAQSPLDLAKIDTQARARIIMNRLVNDLRGAVVWDIADNNPSCSYVKFRKLQGIDERGYYDFLSEYIEYFYDQETNTLSRSELDSEGAVLSKVVFENIREDVFYILSATGENQNSIVCLNEHDLRSRRFIITNVKVEEPRAAGIAAVSSLTKRISVRNE